MEEIVFREVEGDRAAFLAGWNVPVWRVVAGFEATGGDWRRTARRFRVPVAAVRCAVGYAAGHPQEIRVAIRDHRFGGGVGRRSQRLLVRVADELPARATSNHS